MGILERLPVSGDTRRERITSLLFLLGRISLLVRLFRWLILDGFRHVYARGLNRSLLESYGSIKALVVRIILSLPSSKAKIAQEMAKTKAELRAKLIKRPLPDGVALTQTRTLPEVGRSKEWLENEWSNLRKIEDGAAGKGRVSGTVYHGGEELNKIIIEAMSNFLLANPLHSDVFPATRKMESEIISMCLHLFNGKNGAGTTTSGGTESILMSVKTHRDWALKVKGITKPEMIVPSSAHAAFWKASQYFGVKMHIFPVDSLSRKADVRAMKRAINSNTILIVGSAPNFPDGMIDPIPELAAAAKRANIGMHVDCCLGSFLMPFLAKAGLADGIPKFDFSLPGVTAISCDIHKYAFCPKGTSVIMYRSVELRRHQYYVSTDWSGGVYASPSMAGSRPGAVLAGAWAVLNHIGANGYTDSCRTIVSAAREFTRRLETEFVQDLYVLGDPRVSVVAFASDSLNVYALGDLMSTKGWHLNALANPPALHMAFTLPSAGTVDKLVADLAESIAELKKEPPAAGNMVALYGLGQTSVGPHVVDELARNYIDILYE